MRYGLRQVLGLIAGLAVGVTVALGQATDPVATGQAVDPNGWVQELRVADRLAAEGYLDAAQQDYEAIVRKYPSNVAGIDLAWLGLARVHTARNEVDSAKSSIEEVLRRNANPDAMAAARTGYRQIKGAADAAAAQAQQALRFTEYRYVSTPWFNLFGKLFTYLDLRAARKAADAAAAATSNFDPRLLIDIDGPPPAASAVVPSTTATATGTAASATTATAATASHTAPPTASSPAPVATGEPTAQPSVAVATTGTLTPAASGTATAAPSGTSPASPTPDLVTLQRSYQDAYRKVQDAIKSGNTAAVNAASKEYQAALNAYRAASPRLAP